MDRELLSRTPVKSGVRTTIDRTPAIPREVNMATGTHQGMRDQRPDRREGSEALYEQASDAMSNMADRASEMWDEAYDRGARYYRDADGSAIAAAIVAGAVGYALAYLIHGSTFLGSGLVNGLS
jgi:hypothetical protein